jgi:hypothetical protein
MPIKEFSPDIPDLNSCYSLQLLTARKVTWRSIDAHSKVEQQQTYEISSDNVGSEPGRSMPVGG